MATPFSALHDFTMPYLRGVSMAVLDHEIRRVVRQFLRKSTILRETLPFVCSTSSNILTLTPTTNTPPLEVAGVLQVAVNTQFANGGTQYDEIRQAPEDTVQRMALLANPAAPRGFRYYPQSTLLLYPQPDQAYPVQVLVYEMITLDLTNTNMPDVCNDYLDVISRGVIAECMLQPNKPYTDLQSAVLYQRLYGDGVLALRETLRQGGSAGWATVRGPRFGV
jgi:hypothetical protein